jgi:UPF0176 protein
MSYNIAALYQFKFISSPIDVKDQLEKKSTEFSIIGMIMLAKEGMNGTIAGEETKLPLFIKYLKDSLGFDNLELKFSKFDSRQIPFESKISSSNDDDPSSSSGFSPLSPFMVDVPFYRMRISIRKEIVTLGIPELFSIPSIASLEVKQTEQEKEEKGGKIHHILPSQWNNIISDENTIIIDTRNDYEYSLGSFEKAINPKTKTFREFPGFIEEFIKKQDNLSCSDDGSEKKNNQIGSEGESYVVELESANEASQERKEKEIHQSHQKENDHLEKKKKKNLAIFCTGGIRCEKVSYYLSSKYSQKFDNIYQLKGGILKYLEEIPEKDSKWKGDCFVFDQRVSVSHNLEIGNHYLCRACRYPLHSSEMIDEQHYLEGIHCKYCYDSVTMKKMKALQERNLQLKISKERNMKHLGFQYPSHQKKKIKKEKEKEDDVRSDDNQQAVMNDLGNDDDSNQCW